jgi:hypothetical protein
MFDENATKELVTELMERDRFITTSEYIDMVSKVIQNPRYSNADFNDESVKSFTDSAIDQAQKVANSGEAIKQHYAKINRKNKT